MTDQELFDASRAVPTGVHGRLDIRQLIEMTDTLSCISTVCLRRLGDESPHFRRVARRVGRSTQRGYTLAKARAILAAWRACIPGHEVPTRSQICHFLQSDAVAALPEHPGEDC